MIKFHNNKNITQIHNESEKIDIVKFFSKYILLNDANIILHFT